MLPFLPEEKSNQACFWSFTKKDGVFSLLKGDRPLNSRPARASFTRLPTTSETGSRAFSSSRNCGVKRMGLVRIGCPYHNPASWDFLGRGRKPHRAADVSSPFLVFHRRARGCGSAKSLFFVSKSGLPDLLQIFMHPRLAAWRL